MLNNIIDRLVARIVSSPKFTAFLNDFILAKYKKEFLKLHRVWGDESKVKIGNNVQLNDALINTICGDVVIGDLSFMGHGVSLLTGFHDYKKIGLERQQAVPTSGRDIVIGEGVWIASNSTIIGPCTIGDHSVIAAGSIATGDIKNNSVYAGVPAVFVRDIDLSSGKE